DAWAHDGCTVSAEIGKLNRDKVYGVFDRDSGRYRRPSGTCGRRRSGIIEPLLNQDPAMNVPVDPESSVELLRRVRLGDVDALDRLLHRYLPPLEKWARGRLPRWARDLSDTQDLVQDTVLKTLRNLSAFEHRREGALQAYLRQAVMNRIQDDL